MPCNCNKSKRGLEYIVKYPDGSTVRQDSEIEAKRLATKVGGTYTARTKTAA